MIIRETEEINARIAGKDGQVANLTQQRDNLANEILVLRGRLEQLIRTNGNIEREEVRARGEILTLQNSKLITEQTVQARQLEITNGQIRIMGLREDGRTIARENAVIMARLGELTGTHRGMVLNEENTGRERDELIRENAALTETLRTDTHATKQNALNIRL